ncbi:MULTISPECIES: exopolysaccharide biosynthesis polyprenyl glycosylphosphotransferase [unclassified Modicisalibacter]|uniref:exopolysaccharide biosynthesis polyprenyl glycosylphosphotransferase n=1 Tax=unclassified Modicisalibacter TaxID=2679913 RepID=UPI001CCBD73B|nr:MULTISPECIES: exopolysaccharide biosynthesis polyprenyl glycosylphosphotransferase [unclassified Modicisalibacter]
MLANVKKHLNDSSTQWQASALAGGEHVLPADGLDTQWLDRKRRHSRPWERLLVNPATHLLTGWLMAIAAPALMMWGAGFWEGIAAERHIALLLGTLSYLLAFWVVQRLSRLPGVKAPVWIVPCLAAGYGASALGLHLVELPFDSAYLLASFATACVTGLLSFFLLAGAWRPLLAIVPFGRAAALCQDPGVGWCPLDAPSLERVRVNAVVADPRAELGDSWQRFLAECTIHRIPVYTESRALELLYGRIPLDQLPEEVRHGSLSPHEGYEIVKRGLDLFGVLCLLPLALPVMAVTALAIRLDSPGPAFFTQRRMGLCCRQFTLYKFRSMYSDRAGGGFTAAGEDPRVTRVGRVIRKYRLDELPQLFNVLKGDMSLIGPRPESMALTEWYGREVPYFHYRHVVRPGISGWAQVMQGYAAEVDGMVGKLEYDFYYIKNVSFWLDALIVLRTLKTLLTGFGAR